MINVQSLMKPKLTHRGVFSIFNFANSHERVSKVVDEVRESNYCRPFTESFVNCVNINEWKDLSPWDLFEMQLPKDEIDLWAKLTSRNLKKIQRYEVDVRFCRPVNPDSDPS